MNSADRQPWEKLLVTPEMVLQRIEPGMSIFIGTGLSEPRTLLKHLMASDANNLQDLELIQLVSFGDAISLKKLSSHKYRLKTFFSGWVAREAITQGHVDLIPCRFARIPPLIESGQIPVDVAFVQITPPNEAGYCSLGVAVDVARQAMDHAKVVVGEINPRIPRTFGDTFVPIADFDLLVPATEPPLYFDRFPVDQIIDRVARNVASLIEDRSCLAFSIGPLFEALGSHLVQKRHLGIHSPLFTDALMDLIKSGAVTNRFKEVSRGKSLASYAFGTVQLMAWLDRNPLVEFQGIDRVFNPVAIGRNPGFIAIFTARKVDLTGQIALHAGKGNLPAAPGEMMDFFSAANISPGGRTIFALTSRNRKGKPNIVLSVGRFPNLFTLRESVETVVTEYGVANLAGRSVRERAQTLIEIAHPDDRSALVKQAKAQKILYPDQIFLAECAHLYPADIATRHTFKGGVQVLIRCIKPSDEEEMRRLFYRFSDEAVYYRYFTPVKTMPHAKMQEYVNVDCNQVMSIVGLVGEPGWENHIIAEARYIRETHRAWAEVAFVVDEHYQGLGLGTFLYKMLVRLAKERGLRGFTADVLSSNIAMMKVFEKGGLMKAKLEYGVYHLQMPFEGEGST
ncbi:MAG: GNAT family N-acetyltransferase [Desulfobacterales bacterium]